MNLATTNRTSIFKCVLVLIPVCALLVSSIASSHILTLLGIRLLHAHKSTGSTFVTHTNVINGAPFCGVDCQNKKLPVTTSAKIEIPDDWHDKRLSSQMNQDRGFVFRACDGDGAACVMISKADRNGILDMQEFALAKQRKQMSSLRNSSSTDMTELSIDGVRAWRFEVTGDVPGPLTYTYMVTILDGDAEAIVMTAYAKADKFAANRAVFEKISNSVQGMDPDLGDGTGPGIGKDAKQAVEKPNLDLKTTDTHLPMGPGWEEKTLTTEQQSHGMVHFITNKTTGMSLKVTAQKRPANFDLASYANNQSARMGKALKNGLSTPPQPVQITGMNARRFEFSGLEGQVDVTYQSTVIATANEVITVMVYCSKLNFEAYRNDIVAISNAIALNDAALSGQ